MKAVVLSAAIVFAGSWIAATLCALRCASPAPAETPKAAHSHCGASPAAPSDPGEDRCAHGRRGEMLASSATAFKVLPIPAPLERVISRAPAPAAALRAAVLDFAFESPPASSFPSVLRL